MLLILRIGGYSKVILKIRKMRRMCRGCFRDLWILTYAHRWGEVSRKFCGWPRVGKSEPTKIRDPVGWRLNATPSFTLIRKAAVGRRNWFRDTSVPYLVMPIKRDSCCPNSDTDLSKRHFWFETWNCCRSKRISSRLIHYCDKLCRNCQREFNQRWNSFDWRHIAKACQGL